MPPAAQFLDLLQSIIIDPTVVQSRHSPIQAIEDEENIFVFYLFSALILGRPTQIDSSDIEIDDGSIVLVEIIFNCHVDADVVFTEHPKGVKIERI
jgi:hypothetical protein